MNSKVTILDNGEQLAPFQYDFIPQQEGKAITVDEDSGDLYIEGFAATFDKDRQDEAFAPGAFDRGLKAFMETNPVLCYHHKFDKALGQIVDAEIVEGKGLKIRARIDKPTPGSWAEEIFDKVKRGTIRALSVGGIFRRKLTEDGWKIHDMDFAEISVTPVPINPTTTFAVIAGKAFEGVVIPERELEIPAEEVKKLSDRLDKIREIFDQVQ